MALYSYSKKSKLDARRRFIKIFSGFLIALGLSMLIAVIYPIVAFELYYAHRFADLTSPVVAEEDGISKQFTGALTTSFNDLTRASLWFPQATPIKIPESLYNSYALSIPKLSIENAQVLIGNDDLSKSLVHFTGARPGTIGNPVIFGHSTLLLFYNPADYKAIFSKLPELKIGDEIYINYDKVGYTYKVFQMYITSPKDLTVLNQNPSEEQITLVTCVPPGTFFKRFIVKARLEKV